MEEIKNVPYTRQSHPYVERLIGTTRREYLDQLLFWNALDLERKLNQFKCYYNNERGHSALDRNTLMEKAENSDCKVISVDKYRWKSHPRNLWFCQV